MKILKTQNKLEIIGHADTPNECMRISGVVHMAQRMPGVKASVRDGYASFESADEGILSNIVKAIEQDTAEFAPSNWKAFTITKFVAPSEYTLKYHTSYADSSGTAITSFPCVISRQSEFLGITLYRNGVLTGMENLHIGPGRYTDLTGYWDYYNGFGGPYYVINEDENITTNYDFYLSIPTDITIGNTTFKSVEGVEYNGTAYETVQIDGNIYNF